MVVLGLDKKVEALLVAPVLGRADGPCLRVEVHPAHVISHIDDDNT